ncbi:hypothetical protein C6P40_003537 [Pichia californica]|uniref:Uncharacterized protein n=1 Tax=Pichia californica TaxID=460514 RepID=A0A9P7BF75_9ASCO|nr:hypothetical protein C6P40_003537 [[Candida] californica]
MSHSSKSKGSNHSDSLRNQFSSMQLEQPLSSIPSLPTSKLTSPIRQTQLNQLHQQLSPTAVSSTSQHPANTSSSLNSDSRSSSSVTPSPTHSNQHLNNYNGNTNNVNVSVNNNSHIQYRSHSYSQQTTPTKNNSNNRNIRLPVSNKGQLQSQNNIESYSNDGFNMGYYSNDTNIPQQQQQQQQNSAYSVPQQQPVYGYQQRPAYNQHQASQSSQNSQNSLSSQTFTQPSQTQTNYNNSNQVYPNSDQKYYQNTNQSIPSLTQQQYNQPSYKQSSVSPLPLPLPQQRYNQNRPPIPNAPQINTHLSEVTIQRNFQLNQQNSLQNSSSYNGDSPLTMRAPSTYSSSISSTNVPPPPHPLPESRALKDSIYKPKEQLLPAANMGVKQRSGTELSVKTEYRNQSGVIDSSHRSPSMPQLREFESSNYYPVETSPPQSSSKKSPIVRQSMNFLKNARNFSSSSLNNQPESPINTGHSSQKEMEKYHLPSKQVTSSGRIIPQKIDYSSQYQELPKKSRSLSTLTKRVASNTSLRAAAEKSRYVSSSSLSSTLVASPSMKKRYIYPAMVSEVASAFLHEIKLTCHFKYGIEYRNSFSGAEAIDVICRVTKIRDRNLAIILGRSLDSQKLFHDVSYEHKLRDNKSEIYLISDEYLYDQSDNFRRQNSVSSNLNITDEYSMSVSASNLNYSNEKLSTPDVGGISGVFTLLTECYSPTCTRDKICYSVSCPRRFEQKLRSEMQNSSLIRSDSHISFTQDDQKQYWQLTVPKSLMDSLSKREVKRQECIFETINSEKTFIKDLEYVREFWMRPLAETKIIKDKERDQFIRNVFHNINEIWEVNHKFAEALVRRQQKSPIVDSIADIFLDFIPQFTPFITYGAGQVIGKYEFDRQRRHNPLLRRFIEDTAKREESKRLDLSSFLSKPTTRPARYPLLLKSIKDHTDPDSSDYKKLGTAIDLLEKMLTKINFETGKQSDKMNLFQIKQKLLFKPGELVDLKLSADNRKVIYQCVLKKKGYQEKEKQGEIHVYLFDHCLLFIKLGYLNKREVYKVYQRPIPLSLLFFSTTENPPTFRAIRSAAIKTGSSPAQLGQNTNSGLVPLNSTVSKSPISFRYLGIHGYELTLYGTPATQKILATKIEAQTKKILADNDVYTLTPLCSNFFDSQNRINCVVPFDGGRKLLYGTDSGVYTGDRSSATSATTKVISKVNIIQVEIIQEYQIFVVLCDKKLICWPTSVLEGGDPFKNAKLGKELMNHASFFKIGVCDGTMLLCAAKSTSNIVRIFEPIDPIQQKKQKKRFNNSKEDIHFSSEPVSINFLKTKLCVGCSSGFQIVSLVNNTMETLLDPADTSLEFATNKEGLKPLGIDRINSDFLLSYSNFSFFINHNGWRVRPKWLIEWEGIPHSFALWYPYLLAFGTNFIEIRSVQNAELLRVIVSENIRFLHSSSQEILYVYEDDKGYDVVASLDFWDKTNPSPDDATYKIADWKSSGNKKKTTMAALVMCLNLGIPPPDIMRPQEYPYLEAFINPSTYPDTKLALQAIGKSLQNNYESISSRAKYKQSLDPSVEDLKRLCTSLRRNAKDERILFHYNGHGVPQPTHSGEIWVFNRGYTQYIPVSLYDLQNWLGAPYIMVIDTNAAGHVIENNKRFIQKRIDDEANHHTDIASPSPVSAYIESIQLGACQSNEILPLNPDLPADLFTCCLTRPIEMSIKWFILFSPLREKGYYDVLKNKNGVIEIPGKLTDRRTPLGELNWIFIAVTDTIAWTSLSRPLFKKLFRQDLVIAALFRNFLLAKKLMPEAGCHPISDPPLPDVSSHLMWDSWELAIDQILGQMLKKKESEPELIDMTDIPQLQVATTNGENDTDTPKKPKNASLPNNQLNNGWNYQHCSFFQQHLTAFEVWLQYGSAIKEPPQQLPIVLQVLLSQAHRLRALHLLSNFLDLGPWAVYLALSVGMFPYIQKLLQSPSLDLKPILIFIWTRIMSVDYQNAQQELIKDRGYNYFTQMLTFQPRPSQPHIQGNPLVIESPAVNNNVTFADQKAMSAFVLAMFVRNHKQGQKLAFSIDVVKICIGYIETSESPLLRQWSALLISGMVKEHLEAVVIIMRSGIFDKFLNLVNDPIPEIRASIIDALSNFILLSNDGDEYENNYGLKEDLNKQDLKIAGELLNLCNDGSALIRRETVCFFSRFVVKYIQFFLVSAFSQLEEEITLIDKPSMIDEVRRKSPAYGSLFSTVWKALLIASEDPHDEVKNYAQQIIDYIMIKLDESQLGDVVSAMEDYLLKSRSSDDTRSNSADGSLLVKLSDNPKYKGMQPNNSIKMNIPNNIKNDSARRVQSLNIDSRIKKELENSKASGSSVSSTYGFSMNEKVATFKSWLHSFGLYDDTTNDAATSNRLTNLLTQQPMAVEFGTNPRPCTPRFMPKPRNNGYPILPFSSGFLDYSCEYFQESQLGPKEANEPGSEEYMRRIWRRNRNEAIIATTQPQREMSLTGNWKNVVSRMNNTTQPKILQFTQFEKWVASTDERDNITTFDWSKGLELSKISNGNPFGTKITDLKFLNEDHVPLLMTGSSDGVVKIYKNFQDTEKCQVLTAWRALTDIILTPRSVGLVSEWQQSRGTLLVTGDVKVIKVWDAPREKCISDIPVRSTSQILTMTSDQVGGNIIIAGFQDGSMRVYDRRLDAKDSMVKVYQPKFFNEKSPIKNVHMQRGGMRELVSGSSNGLVQLWDIRQDDPIVKFKAFEKTMTTAFIHEHAPIIACASKEVDIYSTIGKPVAKIASSGFINSTLNGTVRNTTYINSLTLHPHRMMLATNHNQNAEIVVYECKENNDENEQFYSREELIGDYN